jgi:Tol biopolymer transport system component
MQWSSDSTSVLLHATGDAPRQVHRKNVITGELTVVSADAAGVPGESTSTQEVWSPDGTQVAFTSRSTNWGTPPNEFWSPMNIWVKDVVTGQLRVVTAAPNGLRDSSEISNIRWSPDGSKLLFEGDVREYSMSRGWFVLDLATGQPRKLPISPSTIPSWLPDSRSLTFQTRIAALPERDGGMRFDIINMNVTPITLDTQGAPVDITSFAVSPDGQRVVYGIFVFDPVTPTKSGYRWMVRSFTDAGGTFVNDDPPERLNTFPIWSPDSRRIAYLRSRDAHPADTNGIADVYVADVVDGMSRLISTTAGGSAGGGAAPVRFGLGGAYVYFGLEPVGTIDPGGSARGGTYLAHRTDLSLPPTPVVPEGRPVGLVVVGVVTAGLGWLVRRRQLSAAMAAS